MEDKLDLILNKLSQLEKNVGNIKDEIQNAVKTEIEEMNDKKPPAVNMNEVFLALYSVKPVAYRDLRAKKNESWNKEISPINKELCKSDTIVQCNLPYYLQS